MNFKQWLLNDAQRFGVRHSFGIKTPNQSPWRNQAYWSDPKMSASDLWPRQDTPPNLFKQAASGVRAGFTARWNEKMGAMGMRPAVPPDYFQDFELIGDSCGKIKYHCTKQFLQNSNITTWENLLHAVLQELLHNPKMEEYTKTYNFDMTRNPKPTLIEKELKDDNSIIVYIRVCQMSEEDAQELKDKEELKKRTT